MGGLSSSSSSRGQTNGWGFNLQYIQMHLELSIGLLGHKLYGDTHCWRAPRQRAFVIVSSSSYAEESRYTHWLLDPVGITTAGCVSVAHRAPCAYRPGVFRLIRFAASAYEKFIFTQFTVCEK